MSDEGENLGRLIPWQIRDVPEAIRDAVVEQARAEGVKVPELLTRLVLDARAAGWSLAASNEFANRSNRGKQSSNQFANTSDSARLRAAVEMVSGLGRAGVPVQKGVAAIANRLVKRELAEIEGPRSKTSLVVPPSPARSSPDTSSDAPVARRLKGSKT